MIKRLLNTIWPALIWSVIIFLLLIIPGNDLPEGPKISFLDKFIHTFLFGVLAFLWNRYLVNIVSKKKILWIFFLTFLACCLFGIGMEYYQKYFVVNRGFEVGDMLADATGALLGWLISKYRLQAYYKGV